MLVFIIIFFTVARYFLICEWDSFPHLLEHNVLKVLFWVFLNLCFLDRVLLFAKYYVFFMLEFLLDVWWFFVVCSYYRWESNWNNVVSKSYFLRSNEASCLPINSCSDEQALLLLAGEEEDLWTAQARFASVQVTFPSGDETSSLATISLIEHCLLLPPQAKLLSLSCQNSRIRE